jgi:hypothetical protein
VLEGDRLTALGGETHQPLAVGEANLADRVGVETDRRAERQAANVGVGQIDRTDIRIQPLGDEIRDVRQGLLQVVRAGDDFGDVRKNGNAVRNGNLRRRPEVGSLAAVTEA